MCALTRMYPHLHPHPRPSPAHKPVEALEQLHRVEQLSQEQRCAGICDISLRRNVHD